MMHRKQLYIWDFREYNMKPDDLFNIWMLRLLLNLMMERQTLASQAEYFGTSVSGISRALEKLRSHFGDPLFVVVKGRLQPTQFMIELRPKIEAMLGSLEALAEPSEFDPRTLSRSFRLSGHSFACSSLASHLTRIFAEHAPGCSLALKSHSRRYFDQLQNNELDFAVVPNVSTAGALHAMDLFRLRRCLLAKVDHPLVSRTFESQADLNEAVHSFDRIEITRYGERLFPTLDAGIAGSGRGKVVFRTFNVGLAIETLIDNNLFVICGVQAARTCVRLSPLLRYVELPENPDDPAMSLVWSDAQHRDPASQWFRSLVREWAAMRSSAP